MPVLPTDKWMAQIDEQHENILEILCEPLTNVFPNVPVEAIHYELVNNGLFTMKDAVDLKATIKQLKKKKVWALVESEFAKLRTSWKGPNVAIYIFPIAKGPIIKNGVAYKNGLFLFVSPQLEEEELKALLAHEYHHACRLRYLNKDPFEITLLDSLLIEGLAEGAVKEIYGEQYLSPWTKRYSSDEVKKIWQSHFLPVLKLKGVQQHRRYLYGDERRGLPLWIGYCLGYRIVESFQQANQKQNQRKLISTPAKEILAKSDFQNYL